MTLEQLQNQLQLAEEETDKGNYAEAERLATEVLTSISASPMAQVREWLLQRAATMISLGFIANNRGDYTLALEQFNAVLSLSEQLNDKSSIAKSMIGIGNVYQNLSKHPRALEYYSKALAAHEELGNKSGVAGATIGIGNVYISLYDYTHALEQYSKALVIYEELGEKSGAALVNGNIGNVYWNLSDYSRALEYYSKALAAYEELGNKRGAVLVTGNIGDTYLKIGDFAQCHEYLQKALLLSEQIGSRYSRLHWLLGLGRLYAQTNFGEYAPVTSKEYLHRAISDSKTEGVKHITRDAYEVLCLLLKQEEQWREALEAKEEYDTIRDEINIEEAKKQAARIDYERKTAEREKQIAIERAQAASEKRILNNILPEEITTRLIKGENPIADHFDAVSILFMDIVEFTKLSTTITAQQLVHLLNAMFKAADGVMRECGLEKIKTIGDAYMAVAGVPTIQEDHAVRAAQAAIKLLEVMKNLEVSFPDELGDKTWIENIPEIEVRIGIHCGPVAAGVVGENKFLYDLWGDAVNTASRMESHGEAGKIHVSEDFKNMLGADFTFIPRGEMEIKGKGTMQTYFLERS